MAMNISCKFEKASYNIFFIRAVTVKSLYTLRRRRNKVKSIVSTGCYPVDTIKSQTNVHTKYQPLHLTDSKIYSGQDFNGQGHYSMLKGQIKVTTLQCKPTFPNQCPYQVSPSYTLLFSRYSLDKILKVNVTTQRSN